LVEENSVFRQAYRQKIIDQAHSIRNKTPAMEIFDTKGKKQERKRCLVSDGKRRLSDAMERQSVDEIRGALLFLSTTPLAWKVPEQERDCETEITYPDEGGCREHLKINVDFHVHVPSHRIGALAFSSNNNNNNNNWTTTALYAAIGPDPIHTEIVRCLLTPQTLRVSKDSTNDNSIVVVVITTNAREKLLEASPDFQNKTPLALACHDGNVELAKLFLEHGADPNQRAGVTPLVLACQEGDLEMARLLLEHGADPNACGNDGLTPLIRMSRSGNLEMVELLLLPEAANNNKNANDDANNNNNNYCFHKNRWGTKVYHYDQQSMNALIHACAENNEAVVRFLAKGGSKSKSSPSPSAAVVVAVASYVNDYMVDPALWYASAHGNSDVVRFLMDYCGARASYRKDPVIYSSTPLEEASQWGHVSTVKVLLERSGSDPRTRSGQKARTQAERSGHSKVVDLLDVWRDRLDVIENSCTKFPLGLLPLLLSRSNDSAHRILCNHAGSLFCCNAMEASRDGSKVCVTRVPAATNLLNA
jgi:ankyrin repeat protein